MCFDGYPMTKQGQAKRALAASATGALLGGVIGAVFLARRNDGRFKIGATTSSPVLHLRALTHTTKREHTLVHTIAVLDSRALAGHLHRRLDACLDDRRQYYVLSPALVEAICAVDHLCEVPAPYLLGSMTNSAFSKYIIGVENAVGVGTL